MTPKDKPSDELLMTHDTYHVVRNEIKKTNHTERQVLAQYKKPNGEPTSSRLWLRDLKIVQKEKHHFFEETIIKKNGSAEEESLGIARKKISSTEHRNFSSEELHSEYFNHGNPELFFIKK